MSTLQNTLLSHLRSLAAKQANGALPDQQLLEAFLSQRSEAAFAALVKRHGPMVLSVCRRVLHNQHDAEDAFQAVFLVFVRKAANIRKQESISSFLHGVAYHVAANMRLSAARRLARERTHAHPPFDDPCDELSWREIRSLLDEELTKLAEQYRTPLVLCYLEGKTQDEAARLLGWSKSTFRRRLDSGRKALVRRLTRRGVTLSAALSAPLLTDAAAQAALPPLLAASTVRAGLAAAMGNTVNNLVSVQVAALAEGGAASLMAKKASVAVVLLLSLTLGVGGLLAHRAVGDRTIAEAPAVPPLQSPPARSASKVQAIEEKGDTITVNGRVLDPDGKPFTGAKIYLIGSGDRPKKHPVRAVSGKDGRFQFTFSRAEYFEKDWIRARAEMWRWCDIVAAAPGYGPAQAWMADVKNELALHLVKESRIDGRVRDLEGRPVEGAEVRVVGSSWSSLLDGVISDKEGRFHLTGLGRSREEELRVSAPTIETQWIKVKTPAEGQATVDVLAGPTKPIEGTIRGRDTGKPLAGVEVWAKLDGHPRGEDDPHLLRTVTDAQGRYRLLGLPKRPLYELTVVPPVEQGYVITAQQADDSSGLDPIRLDFDLTRGAIVRFRLVDRESGRPVRGNVQYSPLIDNPHWLEATHLEPGVIPSRVFFYSHDPDKDNYIKFVAYPGPGVIYAHAGWGNPTFLNARLDPEDEKNGHYPGMKGDHLNGFLQVVPGYRRIDPKPTDRQLVFDILFDPGRTLSGTLADPAGQPVRGATGWGLRLGMMGRGAVRQGEQTLETAAFTATGIDRDKACTLSFVHRGRKLIGQIVVQPDDKGPLTVRLRPWGSLTGRLVDAEGKPLADMKMRLRYPNSSDSGMRPPDLEFATDPKGRFRVEGLLPKGNHELILGHGAKKLEQDRPRNEILPADDVLKKVRTRAGETKDLGDIAVKASSAGSSIK